MNLYAYCGGNPIGRLDPLGYDGLWYDRLSGWISEKVNVAKEFYYERTHWTVGGALGTAMDFVTGVAHLPSAIGHLGEGMGCWAGSPNDPNAQIAAWGDVQTVLGLAAGGALPRAGNTYVLRAASGSVQRTGRTYLPTVRSYVHLKKYPGLRFDLDATGLTYAQMRGRAQILSDKHRPILDKINEISPRNPLKGHFMSEGAKVFGKW